MDQLTVAAHNAAYEARQPTPVLFTYQTPAGLVYITHSYSLWEVGYTLEGGVRNAVSIEREQLEELKDQFIKQ